MKAAASSAHQQLQVLLLVTLLAVTAAEYRHRPPGPPGPQGPPHHMRGPPPPHKSYSSPAKHHQHHHFHQNSYSGPSYSKGPPQFNRPMRYRKPGPPPQINRPTSWENPSYKPSGMVMDRYKSPQHYSSGEPPASVSSSSPSVSHLSNSGSLGGLESFSSAMDFKHLSPDLSPIRTIPAPNLGPTSWPSAAHVGVGPLASHSSGVFSPQLQHHSLDMTDATAAALLASSKQHGYQVSEAPPLFAPDPDPSHASPIIRPGLESKLHNDLSLRLSPYTAMPQLMSQAGYSALSSLPTLSSPDLFHYLNGFPLQQDAHSYLRQGQTSMTDAAQLQSQLHQAQLQQAQLQQAQLQQAQLQQAQLQQAQLQQSQVGSSPSQLRFTFDEQHEQLLHSLPGRRGQLPQELEGADSTPVVRLYHSHGPRHPSNHEDTDSDVDGSESSGISVSPSPSPAQDGDEYDGEASAEHDSTQTSDGDYNDSSHLHEEPEEVRPTRIRTRKNRDRVQSA